MPTFVGDLAVKAKDSSMNKDRIEGVAKEGAGSMKEAVGKAVGNDKLVIKGATEKATGKIQNAIGIAKDAFKS